MSIDIDKNFLFDEVSIGKLNLCVKVKAIIKCSLAALGQA